jgi:hypothetical protein
MELEKITAGAAQRVPFLKAIHPLNQKLGVLQSSVEGWYAQT